MRDVSESGERIRVLHVCKHYRPFTGGVENVVNRLVTGIDDVSFRVLTAVQRGRGRIDEVAGISTRTSSSMIHGSFRNPVLGGG